MKALGGSYLKFFVSRHTERVGLDFCLCRHDFGFLLNQKRVGDGLVSFRANCVPSISTAASAQSGLESEEVLTVNSDQPKTVRVRFKLHKQCAFGQQFVLVGDDPSLGLWDPSGGVPLNWSEGHLWTAEVNILSRKVISYKFILKEITGSVTWQPGPDRVLETWDTANTISVTEDWEIPEFQIIHEEEVVDDSNKVFLNVSDPLVAENSNQLVREEEGDDTTEERVDGNEHTSDQSDKPSTVMVAENIAVEDLGLMSVADDDDGSDLMMDEGLPVLVRGLATTPPKETELEASSIVGSTTTVCDDEIVEVSTNLNQENDIFEVSTDPKMENNTILEEASTEFDETEAATELEIHASASLDYAEMSEVLAAKEEEQQLNGRKKMERNILGGDIQWGKQTLHKFLANLGFMPHG